MDRKKDSKSWICWLHIIFKIFTKSRNLKQVWMNFMDLIDVNGFQWISMGINGFHGFQRFQWISWIFRFQWISYIFKNQDLTFYGLKKGALTYDVASISGSYGSARARWAAYAECVVWRLRAHCCVHRSSGDEGELEGAASAALSVEVTLVQLGHKWMCLKLCRTLAKAA